ncbi:MULTISPECIES: GIY-YIG nuclease family protein [unclassified Microcoleus]|uniref:GIY-YIG nuclease family protein n=1 Tax=unclassified Microcoleus TaxID=2642155 RepID=UPI002FD3C2B3
MAPISARMQGRYDYAVQSMIDFLEGNTAIEEIEPDQISELKGMFNRCLRKDQWDWFNVFACFGSPSGQSLRPFIPLLIDLRRSVISGETQRVGSISQRLLQLDLLRLLRTFQDASYLQANNTEGGWIYILSTREQPNILKIGMTCRSVTQRVKEINSATGVLFPLSPRAVFRVKYAAKAEREIFVLLNQYRIRSDREFFNVPFKLAANTIEIYIQGIENDEA